MSLSRFDKLLLHLSETTFYIDPASTKYHGSYEGGLRDHSYNVMTNLVTLTDKLGLKWQDHQSPNIIGIAHDVCKIGSYVSDGNGGYKWNPYQPKGHGEISIQRIKEWIDLTEEEELCIRWHMGPYTGEKDWQLYAEAIHKYPNVLWTHTADMMATHIDEVRD